MYDGASSLSDAVLRIIFPFIGWFIPAYLGLYLISPILNLYAQNVDGRFAVKYLIVFFIIQTLLEHVFPYCTIFGRTLFNHGYSILSFIGLYLLGRYVKFNIDSIPRHKVSSWAMAYAGVFVFSALTITILLALPGRMAHLGDVLIRNATENSSPVVIAGSFCLFMAFEGMRFTSRVVNILATSALGVFCFSDFSFYAPIVRAIYHEYSGIVVLALDLAFILGVYFAGVLIDQVRVYAWKGAVGLIKRRQVV